MPRRPDLKGVGAKPLVRPLASTRRAKPERGAQPVVKVPERRRGRAAPHIRRRSRDEMAKRISRPMLVFKSKVPRP